MPASLATVLYALGIIGLMVLDRDRTVRLSRALWLPIIWLSIGGSRMVSQWLQPGRYASAHQLLDGSPLDRNVLSALIALGIVVLVRRRRRVRAILGANRLLVAFLLYCAASIVWSDYPMVAFKRWVKTFGDLIMVLIIASESDSTAALKRVLARMGFLLVPLSILLIKYYPEIGRGYANFTWEPIVTGVTTGKNLLGVLCFIAGLGASWRLICVSPGTGRWRRLVPQLTLLTMVGWLFWQADSMTSMLCFLMATLLLLVTRSASLRRSAVALHVVVIATLAIACSVLFLDVGGGFLEAIGRDPTLTGRTEVWSVALSFSGNPLFGTGFESFWLGERLEKIGEIYWWQPNEAHNGYLELYLNLGWFGVAAFVVMIGNAYGNIIRSVRRAPDVGGFRLAFFVAVLAYSCTEAAFRSFQPIWVVFLATLVAVPDRVGALARVATPEVDTPFLSVSSQRSGEWLSPRVPLNPRARHDARSLETLGTVPFRSRPRS